MKRRAFRSLKQIGKRLMIGQCVMAQVAIGFAAASPKNSGAPARAVEVNQAATPSSVEPAAPVKVNRTIPRVEPPKPTLEFSASPTPPELFRARLFEEPLVPVGGQPTAAENTALAAALLGYANRSSPDDFSSLTGFLAKHPKSPWSAALLINLGLEYYNTAHYSLTMPAWSEAWRLAKDATEASGKAIADRAVGELAYMFARLGRMAELDALLKSVADRVFTGPATERISGAREGLWTMQNEPGIAFRCGPLALHRIKLFLDPKNAGGDLIHTAASTKDGFSLPQVVALSQKLGLNYQMAFRDKGADIVVPSVIHWKVGHYAAIVGQEGDRYLLQDPTFRNDAWITRAALEAEASGYFVIPPGPLSAGWRAVQATEGGIVWGKGTVGGPCSGCGPGPPPPNSCQDPSAPSKGMAVSSVGLLFVSLGLSDEPVGYSPPVGPPVHFMVRYNQRDASQPASFTYSNFGAKWTFDWLSYIKDNPSNPNAGVEYYRMGGFVRNFTSFDSNTQSFAYQELDRTKLTRTAPTSYEMVSADGSKVVFSQSDGSSGTSRKIFLKQIIDSAGNAVALTYDANLRIVAVADAIGQVTTLSYEHPTDLYKITKVTDPFGRFATFDYDASNRLTKITDVIGLTSEFAYEGASDFISALITPYGTTAFTRGGSGTTRSLETLYPDGQKERVEFNQSSNLGIPNSDPPASVPTGVATRNEYLFARNTYFWSKIACATAYGDYTKAKLYHWLHTADGTSAARVLESEKEPLEGRVWYDYAGQGTPISVGTMSQPAHIGRVLDDGSTQLYTYEYNDFGNATKMIDPVGRTFSYHYATNGIDLLETRMTRNGANELLSQITYNAAHQPLTVRDAAGQTTTNTYNARSQLRTTTNAKSEVTTYNYDTDGYVTSIDGPLPGADDANTWTYDVAGRVRTRTDESGYTLTFDYDAMDHLTKITYPDGTFNQFTFTRLDHTLIRDRAGRQTSFQYNSVRQLIERTDPLNRATLFQWCKCGDITSLTDPMGRTTTWQHDVQGRVTNKQYPDGSAVSYLYENTISRVRQRIDEKLQVTQYSYTRDGAVSGMSYLNVSVPTPTVAFTYDASYARLLSMTDGAGTTLFSYIPITSTPAFGAGGLSSVDGPMPNDTIAFAYDELGRRVSSAINGVASALSFDAAGRIAHVTNTLGSFDYTYDASSYLQKSQTCPNGQREERSYTDTLQDRSLHRINNRIGNSLLSEFIYGHDAPTGLIGSWSQQASTQVPLTYTFRYDAAGQVTGTSVSEGTNIVKTFGYAYDAAGNRLNEGIDNGTSTFTYNSLNQLTESGGASLDPISYEWDGEQRLTAANTGNQRTEFSYDGFGRRVGIREVVNGLEVANRRFLWCDEEVCEERTPGGTVSKRYFIQGVRMETGPSVGNYFYTRDHLESIREVTDSKGAIRARFSYDPFGRRSRQSGDVEIDFGFAGMFWATQPGMHLTKFRAYDSNAGRWLSRDPISQGELVEGPNLYAYVNNDPISLTDPFGLQAVDPKRPYSPPSPQCSREPLAKFAGSTACLACVAGLAFKVLGPPGVIGTICKQCSMEPIHLPCKQPPPPPPPTPPAPPTPPKPSCPKS
jgi:RHS repeat-associated protein